VPRSAARGLQAASGLLTPDDGASEALAGEPGGGGGLEAQRLAIAVRALAVAERALAVMDGR
jgi:hypothetical protein